MRVIAGEFRSRRLQTLPGLTTRPTPDRLRESLFSILQPELEGATFLDLYAGSGAVGIEALSRGASAVALVESNRAALAVLRENLRSLGIEARVEVFAGKATRVLSWKRADVVFLDPPYEKEREYAECLSLLGAAPPVLAAVQHSVRFDPGEQYGTLRRARVLRQGDNAVTFYRPVD